MKAHFGAFLTYRQLRVVIYTRYEVLTLQGESAERWQTLCAQAAVEQDPQKLLELVSEIARLLDEKGQRLSERQTKMQKAG
jgi:hypothetical protein